MPSVNFTLPFAPSLKVCSPSGFNSIASFYSYFAKKQGTSPSDYYERFRGGDK